MSDDKKDTSVNISVGEAPKEKPKTEKTETAKPKSEKSTKEEVEIGQGGGGAFVATGGGKCEKVEGTTEA
jgi:hypothetical protein